MRPRKYSVRDLTPILCALALGVLPSSAVSERIQRPRLFFGPADTATIREKVTREPFRSLVKNYLYILDEAGGFLEYASSKGELLGGLAGIDENVAQITDMQLAAVAYVATNELAYARTAKELLIKHMEGWEDYIPKAGRGASLSVSRHGQIYCWVYDFIEPSGLFTSDEEQYVTRILAAAMTRLMERGETFNPFDYHLPKNNQWSRSYLLRMDNYNSDRVMALGLFALTFPRHPRSEQWLTHALEEFDWQMENSRMPDGSWKEYPRYHGAVMRGFVPFAYALKRNKSINLFEDKRFKAMFEALIHYQTPRDRTVGGVALTPGIGDSNWENVWQSFLGWGAAAYKELDPALAGRLIWAWQRAGSPLNVEMSPANQMAGFVFVDDSIQPLPQPNLSSENLRSGYSILRNAFNTPDESYFLLSVATHREHLGHHQWDNGSFSLYAFNTPITVDPGSRDYSLLEEWYGRSKSHNVVVFDDNDIVVNGAVSHSFFDEPLEYVEADLSEAVKGDYKRRIFFIKPHCYLVWDDIDTVEDATYHLHVLTENDAEPTRLTNDSAEVQRLLFTCQQETKLELAIVSPRCRTPETSFTIVDDPHPVEFFAEKEFVMQLIYRRYPKWLQIGQMHPGQDFITLLYPKQESSNSLDLLRYDPPLEDRATRDDPRLGDPRLDDPTGDEDRSSDQSGSRVALRLGSISTRLLLGSRAYGAEMIDADAAVVIRDEANAREETYLINGKRVRTAENIDIAIDPPTSIVVSSRLPGRAYKIRVLEKLGSRLKVSLPWKCRQKDVHVFDTTGAEIVNVDRDLDNKTIGFRLTMKEYWLLAEPLRPESLPSELEASGGE